MKTIKAYELGHHEVLTMERIGIMQKELHNYFYDLYNDVKWLKAHFNEPTVYQVGYKDTLFVADYGVKDVWATEISTKKIILPQLTVKARFTVFDSEAQKETLMTIAVELTDWTKEIGAEDVFIDILFELEERLSYRYHAQESGNEIDREYEKQKDTQNY